MTATVTSRKLPIRVAGLLAVALVALALGEVLYVCFGENFFAVVSGQCYRSAQPSPRFLRTLSRTHGIQTVLNLRGPNAGKSWYDDEHEAAVALGIRIVDLPLSSNCPPRTHEFRQLVHLMDTAPRPILLHCHSGADRTGMASMVYLLLQPGSSLEEARTEISVRYGHKFWSEARNQKAIAVVYEGWLKNRGEAHSAERFRYWAMNVYRAGTIWNHIGQLSPFPEDMSEK